ncbi:MAG: hypothetical protein ABEL04_08490 [Salinibacter sp.]|uniref:hypothetical protein n=1 Tax=Salinibacter sp. TaxID=2065818 RepID=UPI0035D4D827
MSVVPVSFLGTAAQYRCFLLVFLLCSVALPSSAQRFLRDDPLWTDPDRTDITFPEARPAPEGIGPFEFLSRTFVVPGEYSEPAQNINTVGGVPNSSWYTNRHYRFPMSKAELRRGPNVGADPPRGGPWRVTRVRQEGELARMVVRDTTGRRFTLHFDARAYPEMATGAAMIGSRLLYALGYNVPQHWLRRIRPARLVPAADGGVTPADVDSVLAFAARRSDGTYRVLATRIPDVERRIGPFRFQGTRPDDGNDVFPHEDRRELRGLRIFAAWIHHTNIRPRHTLDVGVRDDGRRFVRHYLTDLHLTLGSDGASPKPRWAGHEYVLELDRVFERVTTLGLSGGEWAETDVPDWPAVGHFSADHFDPTKWRPKWPNPAFQRCEAADAFWAAKQVRNFSEAELKAIVATAEYSSPQVGEYILRTLLRRRNAIGRAYLRWGGGLGRFAVQGGQLAFQDLRAKYALAPDSLRRTVTWHVYDNQQEAIGRRLLRMQSSRESIPIPWTNAAFLRATLHAPQVGSTRVFLRRVRSAATSPLEFSGSYEVVGVERQGTAEDAP